MMVVLLANKLMVGESYSGTPTYSSLPKILKLAGGGFK